MPKQRFEDLPGVAPDLFRKAANICLYLGYDTDSKQHLPTGEHEEARMAWNEWDTKYAKIMARLSAAAPGPARPFVVRGPKIKKALRGDLPFRVCPNLTTSFISLATAKHFGLTIHTIRRQTHTIPLSSSLTSRRMPVSSKVLARAYITIKCDSAVTPRPFPMTTAVTFLVLDEPKTPTELAIFGRNVIKHLLLLYSGSDPVNRLMREDKKPARFYFGRVKGN